MILNKDHIKYQITNNAESGSVSYRWTHGATDEHLGLGIFYYTQATRFLIYTNSANFFKKSLKKVCTLLIFKYTHAAIKKLDA